MQTTVNDVVITLTPEQESKVQQQLALKNKQVSAEDTFLKMWNGCETRFDFSKSESVFLLKNNEVWFEQDLKYGYLWCHHVKIWSVFETEFGMNYEQIQAFIKDLLERRFKLGSLTPDNNIPLQPDGWKDVSNWGH
jgi:hypothetical protein